MFFLIRPSIDRAMSGYQYILATLLMVWSLVWPLSPCYGQNSIASITASNGDPTLEKINLATSQDLSRTITVTTDSPITANAIATLHLQLESGTVAIGKPVVASAPSPSQSVMFTGSFAGLPDHYDGQGHYFLRIQDPPPTPASPLPVPRTVSETSSRTIRIDRVPPRIVSVRPVAGSRGADLLIVTLVEQNPLDSYVVSDSGSGKEVTVTVASGDENLLTAFTKFSVVNQQINIPLKTTVAGLITINVGSLKDDFGNELTSFSQTLGVTPQRPSGPAVEYPRFAVPDKAGRHTNSNEIRPSNRVQTRVVRLYYYRDAHRVAEIINRRAQQFNLVGTKAKRALAEEARERAEDATAKRRQAQRQAEAAARSTRQLEREVEALQVAAEEARDVQNQLVGYPGSSFVVPAEGTDRLAILTKEDLIDGNEGDGLTTIDNFREQLRQVIKEYEDAKINLNSLQQTEVQTNNAARSLEDNEDRLIRTQFLRELDAAQEDPNTYAPGDIDSIDPVMQTSVSVIGEGVIQLRGPIEGINQVRRMIHQIDVPVGQVKVELETVQINGEKGDELEETVQLVEGYINSGRFLTNQALVFLRRSVTEVAAEVAQENGQPWQRDQMGRDLRYLYSFFGQDFIDTLYRMDSEFLHTENQILTLHSMDSISRNRAMLLIGLSKNSVRQRILDRFQQHVQNDLPALEHQYRTVNKAIPCEYLCDDACDCGSKLRSLLHRNCETCVYYGEDMAHEYASRNYLFLNFHNFFAQGAWTDATLNPMQREFIRLAQVFKSQLIAEIELKQRIVERGLMDQKLSDDQEAAKQALLTLRTETVNDRAALLAKNLRATQAISNSITLAYESIAETDASVHRATVVTFGFKNKMNEMRIRAGANEDFLDIATTEDKAQMIELFKLIPTVGAELDELEGKLFRTDRVFRHFRALQKNYAQAMDQTQQAQSDIANTLSRHIDLNNPTNLVKVGTSVLKSIQPHVNKIDAAFFTIDANQDALNLVSAISETSEFVTDSYDDVLLSMGQKNFDARKTLELLTRIRLIIPSGAIQWAAAHNKIENELRQLLANQVNLKFADNFLKENRLPLQQLKLLDHLIDEHEEKSMNLLEGKRSHISAIDNFLKRMTFALEDDFQIQFYDPSLTCIRKAARGERVTLSQVERTTVLGNNRELLKVLPQATMEFDLPNRKLRVTEAMQGAKALVDDYGALLKDPTFLAAYQMMGGGIPAESIRKVHPGLPTEGSQEFHALPAAGASGRLGESLQSLVPDPEIYQFETGTGFEVRPVIQPDGDSLVYDLTYLYTTQLREPVRADEKHLGRIKRHLIHTQVQTSSYELREVGRYQVALKAARTARGVPMLENAPLVGGLFRPAPSEESSIQQNIVLGKSVIYPTLYDLMGLRWAPHVAELGYDQIRTAGHVARGREAMIRNHVFDKSSSSVDDFMQIDPDDEHYRPDLYHTHDIPSPYHPNGYIYPEMHDDEDLTRRGFRIPDRRPESFKIDANGTGMLAPQYDERFGVPHTPQPMYLDYEDSVRRGSEQEIQIGTVRKSNSDAKDQP